MKYTQKKQAKHAWSVDVEEVEELLTSWKKAHKSLSVFI